MNTAVNDDREWFAAQTRSILSRLYDARALRASALISLLGLESAQDPALILRQRVVDAIEQLRLPGAESAGAHDWRLYQILRRRYVQQLTQERVAMDIGLSVRQLQREEQIARLELADYLWDAWRIGERLPLLAALRAGKSVASQTGDADEEAWQQELDWLERSAVIESCSPAALLDQVFDLARPTLEALRVTVAQAPAAQASVSLRAAIARQGLLNLLTLLAHRVSGGHLVARADLEPQRVIFALEATPQAGDAGPTTHEEALSLARLERLTSMMGGALNVQVDEAGVWQAALALPLAQSIGVLVIDDNPDALQLFQRYLAGTRYAFFGARNGAQALSLADAHKPPLIVLDVVMPGQDGWSLLARLRHAAAPATQNPSAPAVIVCSILGQKDLARHLGADDLLLKPVSRATLLQALDQQWRRIAASAG